ncbi:L-aspartate oxidase [Streptomyces sp. NPDC051776]|uniref:L-aspartate oxidase n=1 Tax=Streptomyces sp. NPDC051776 TaxID=3155414 RepID=UPI00342911F0
MTGAPIADAQQSRAVMNGERPDAADAAAAGVAGSRAVMIGERPDAADAAAAGVAGSRAVMIGERPDAADAAAAGVAGSRAVMIGERPDPTAATHAAEAAPPSAVTDGGRPGPSAPQPGTLRAPAPGWAIEADVVVVGSGVAGLTAALRCAAAGRRTVVVTKARLDDGSTRWAQGGIAAALGEGDTPEQHLDDTLVAGAGLCDEKAVRTLVTEGPDAVRRLMSTGARFDTSAETGAIELTREGGHHRRRIAHAGGDATGAEISRALVDAVRDAGIETVENALVLDLLTDAEGRTAGVTLHVMGEGQRDGVGAVHAPAVVLATGGMGQVFSATTNPAVSTGDGVALALRAGAEVSDLEFVQFHPTVLFLGRGAEGQQPLVSEAVRGEGAHLVDADGVRFMLGQHELGELAPRDIVAKAIMRRMQEQGAEHMYLDARHFGSGMWATRFPTILAACRAHGIDPVTEPIPVAPAAHYASGGVRTDLAGRTTVPGLYACGEVACTGVHGANRLASNSLLEGLVFAERIASAIAAEPPARPVPVPRAPARTPLLAPESRFVIQRIMTAGAGVLRSDRSLNAAAVALQALHTEAVAELDRNGKTAEPCVETWEATNLLLVSRVLVAMAREREETRGCHWREDRPERDDEHWRRHLVARLAPECSLALRPTATAEFPPVQRSATSVSGGRTTHPEGGTREHA